MNQPFKLDFAPTDRGFLHADFRDRQGGGCSIQKSSLATEDCVWLGMNEGTHHMGECLARMHLTREMSRELALALLGFAVSGELGDKGKGSLQNLRAAFERVELTDEILQANHQYAQSFANLTMQLQGSLSAGVKLERELADARARIAELETKLEEANERASMLARRPDER